MALLAFDRKLSGESLKKGFLGVYRDNLAPDARLYRPSFLPAVGIAAALELLAKSNGSLTWEPMAAQVSRAGDLGYSYGMAKLVNSAQGRDETVDSYLRIWKKASSGEWRIVLDVASEVPPPAKKD
jgi:ketosteroid isomerase-like protein